MHTLCVVACAVFLALGIAACKPTPTDGGFHPLRTADFDEQAFNFQGKLIHPGCLWEFEVWLSDGGPPRAVAVDVESCTSSNANREPVNKTSAGFLVACRTENGVAEYFGYKQLGMTSSGTHVLQVYRSGGGGTMVEDNVYLVRFEMIDYYEFSSSPPAGRLQKRLVMRCVGQIVLGDRDDGTVELRGNILVLGKSRYRVAEELKQLQ